jgi:hypothetical protein
MSTNKGASLLEMMFAVAISTAALPFAYRTISDLSREMHLAAAARRIALQADPIKNYIRLNQSEFMDSELSEIKTEDFERMFIMKSGESVHAFAVSDEFTGDILSSYRVAKMIGPDAAVIEADGTAYSSSGGWAVKLDANEGDIVYRVVYSKTSDDTAKYLHRSVLSEDGLATMNRDLSMGGFSIVNTGEAEASKLTTTDLDTYLAKTPLIAATALYFANGLNLNPEKSHFPNMRVVGDAVGFRNFWADDFSGSGRTTADRASVSKSLVVMNKFEAKSPYSRTISGFAGASANVVRAAYLDVERLTFLPGFGLTISSELMYSATPSVKLGSWFFPSVTGPKFSSLALGNLGGAMVAMSPVDFSGILKEGWR